jgi:hypothetical protein
MTVPTRRRGPKMKSLTLAGALAILLASCVGQQRNQSQSLHLTPFQEEVIQWHAAAQAMSTTGVEPAPQSKRELAWRELHIAWGEETYSSLERGGRQPAAIHREVVSRTKEQERRFIDECVRHGYDLVEVLAFVDFEKDNLENTIYSAVEDYVRYQRR